MCNALAVVPLKDRKTTLSDVKAIGRAETTEAVAAQLDAFEEKCGARYPADQFC